jgi:transcriptional regulator with XRE-family HTH domain
MNARPKPATASGRLRAAMIYGQKTLGQLAEETGSTPANLSRFMNGHSQIRSDTFDALAEALGLELVAIGQQAAHSEGK